MLRSGKPAATLRPSFRALCALCCSVLLCIPAGTTPTSHHHPTTPAFSPSIPNPYSPQVFLDQETVNLYYNGFCNSVLWNLFHYVPLTMDSKLTGTKTMQLQWDAYKRANRAFCQVVLSVRPPAPTHADALLPIPVLKLAMRCPPCNGSACQPGTCALVSALFLRHCRHSCPCPRPCTPISQCPSPTSLSALAATALHPCIPRRRRYPVLFPHRQPSFLSPLLYRRPQSPISNALFCRSLHCHDAPASWPNNALPIHPSPTHTHTHTHTPFRSPADPGV